MISDKAEHLDTMKGDYHPKGNHGYDVRCEPYRLQVKLICSYDSLLILTCVRASMRPAVLALMRSRRRDLRSTRTVRGEIESEPKSKTSGAGRPSFRDNAHRRVRKHRVIRAGDAVATGSRRSLGEVI